MGSGKDTKGIYNIYVSKNIGQLGRERFNSHFILMLVRNQAKYEPLQLHSKIRSAKVIHC